MKTEYIILKNAILNNNCPECYATKSLQLSFKQKKVLSKFYIKTEKEVIESMDCQKCGTNIYPGRWTDDIERVYEYHKKTIDKKSAGIRFTKLFYLLLFLAIVICASIIYTYISFPEYFTV
ncbi:hypothetical protein [Aquimarina litoralis]|uniref:hypothetical protein n=1 Tax=Aquimarina litoralis TaxID=584605 RepID=UPI001C585165|nr:hypothetical protein [Aquimarina litoralis]MBW1295272.1 hypothetical protein [Aquimarina litoralis]